MEESLSIQIFNCQEEGFDSLCDRVRNYQSDQNPLLRAFYGDVKSKYPFVPIAFFRKFRLFPHGVPDPTLVFRSSGTTSSDSSRHFVHDAEMYHRSIEKGFELAFGDKKFLFLALLPHYLERGDSSLVYMMKHLIEVRGLKGSGFFLDNFEDLHVRIESARRESLPIFLIGASYALLDFGQGYSNQLENAVVVETGGMKGRRKELTREELHLNLKAAFGLDTIYSEYGMTELLSQAWYKGNSFSCPPWMRVIITDPNLPDLILPQGRSGRINVIDLANLYSCSFISTDDIGRQKEDGSFEVLGRMDNTIMRGCNLLYENID